MNIWNWILGFFAVKKGSELISAERKRSERASLYRDHDYDRDADSDDRYDSVYNDDNDNDQDDEVDDFEDGDFD